jgi:hypothetical protein
MMAAKKATPDPAAATAATKPMSRHDAALSAHENNPRYWIFRNSEGILWVNAVGQAAARLAAGDVVPNFIAMYANAGEALRFCEQTAKWSGQTILNLTALEAAAKLDPEPKNGANDAWQASKKAVQA